MTTTADWVRIAAFIGNAILFYASLRNQRWAKKQAIIEGQARKVGNTSGEAGSPASRGDSARSREVTQADLDQLAADFAARPYFDHAAYRLLCAGFAVTAGAALLDLWISGTLARLSPF